MFPHFYFDFFFARQTAENVERETKVTNKITQEIDPYQV
jgi:hypothetical protein